MRLSLVAIVMSRRFQYTMRDLLAQATLAAVGFACVRLVGLSGAPLVDACLIKLTAIAFGAAYGMLFEKAAVFALLTGLAATPLAFDRLAPDILRMLTFAGIG